MILFDVKDIVKDPWKTKHEREMPLRFAERDPISISISRGGCLPLGLRARRFFSKISLHEARVAGDPLGCVAYHTPEIRRQGLPDRKRFTFFAFESHGIPRNPEMPFNATAWRLRIRKVGSTLFVDRAAEIPGTDKAKWGRTAATLEKGR
jgi:hypothetical protein